LFNIFNRVKLLNGDYSIETSPGNGFSLRIIFPTSS
jgi:signal transduction histidine kinase